MRTKNYLVLQQKCVHMFVLPYNILETIETIEPTAMINLYLLPIM